MASTNYMQDSRLGEFISRTPAPGETPSANLAHVIGAFHRSRNSDKLAGVELTWGEFRDFANNVSAGRKAVTRVVADNEDVSDDTFFISATHDVYGDGVRTGLTWGEIRALVA